ncbi:hypothetical protein [Bosea sp. RAC05]|uniref:hypothetical protein n=1 Tax=Bosea sp. RAC05 TaxID=1842539 RepID=UPI001AECB8EC|nr:hypothetical protein [Bosea sp. RAC05]
MTAKKARLKARIAAPRGKGFVSGTLDLDVRCVSAKAAPVVLRGPAGMEWRHHDGQLWRPVRDGKELRSPHVQADYTEARRDPTLALGLRLLGEASMDWDISGAIDASLGIHTMRFNGTKRAQPIANIEREPLTAQLLKHAPNFMVIGDAVFERTLAPMMAVRFLHQIDDNKGRVPPDRPLVPFWIEPTGRPTLRQEQPFWAGTNSVGYRSAPVYGLFELQAIRELAFKHERAVDTSHLDAVRFEVLDVEAVQGARGDLEAFSSMRLGRALLTELIAQRVKSVPMERLRAAHELRRVFHAHDGADPIAVMRGTNDRYSAFDVFTAGSAPNLDMIVQQAIASIERHPFRAIDQDSLYQIAVAVYRDRSVSNALTTDGDLDDLGALCP